jgi:hypothetical protein
LRAPFFPPRARAAGVSAARLRAELARAFADPELASTRSMLLLDGFDVLPNGFYDCMFEAEAKRGRYLELD